MSTPPSHVRSMRSAVEHQWSLPVQETPLFFPFLSPAYGERDTSLPYRVFLLRSRHTLACCLFAPDAYRFVRGRIEDFSPERGHDEGLQRTAAIAVMREQNLLPVGQILDRTLTVRGGGAQNPATRSDTDTSFAIHKVQDFTVLNSYYRVWHKGRI